MAGFLILCVTGVNESVPIKATPVTPKTESVPEGKESRGGSRIGKVEVVEQGMSCWSKQQTRGGRGNRTEMVVLVVVVE